MKVCGWHMANWSEDAGEVPWRGCGTERPREGTGSAQRRGQREHHEGATELPLRWADPARAAAATRPAARTPLLLQPGLACTLLHESEEPYVEHILEVPVACMSRLREIDVWHGVDQCRNVGLLVGMLPKLAE